MLSRGTAHTYTALDDAVDLTIALSRPPFLIVFFYIAEGSFICQRTDGACAEGLALSEDNLRIIVSLALILTREVQIDVRLLVALKSKEGFKRNVKSVLFQRGSADRAGFIRHIAARHSGKSLYLLRVKVIVTALWTMVMRA